MIDLAAVTAIDVHVHTESSRAGHDPMPAELREAARNYFHADEFLPTVDDVAAYYRERNLAAVVFTVDWESQSGVPPIPNEEIAEGAAANSDVLIPFASVDPARPDAVERARRLIAEHDVKGFKFHPNLQAFFPNDRSAYPLYEAIAEAGLPALFHSGHSGIGTGVPGGGGLRMKYSDPMCLDDVAADFPELQIVLAHPSFPWQDEAISVCLHKSNVWIDLSGWSPKYFPPQLVQYANTQLSRKVLFGSDYPLITPDRWLADFEQAPFKDEVRPLILKENAARLLGSGLAHALPACCGRVAAVPPPVGPRDRSEPGPVADAGGDVRRRSLQPRAEPVDEDLDRRSRAVHREVDRRDHVTALPAHGDRHRSEAVRELLVVHRQPCGAHPRELGREGLRIGHRVRPPLDEVDLLEAPRQLVVGQEGEQHLPHRGAVRGQARSDVEVEVDLALALLRAPAALDVDDVDAVEDRHVDGVAGLVAELLEVGRRDLAELHRVDRGQPEVDDARPEPILPRVRVLLEVAETRKRGDVAV